MVLQTNDARFNKILIDHGVSFSVEPDEISEATTLASANLPMLPDIFAANRVIADAIGVGAMVDPDPDRERARRNLRNRMVLNESGKNAHIANVEFFGQVNTEGEVIIRSTILLPGYDLRQEVSPLINVGIDFLIDLGGGKFCSNGTIQCLIFKPIDKKGRPINGKGLLKALPLGVADPSTVSIWNRVAREMKGKNWPEIKLIPNNLRRHGVCVTTFLPTHDPDFVRIKGSRKRLLVGKLFGQKFWLSPKSQLPEVDVVDGKKCFSTKHVFCVKLSEKDLVVTWLGPEGKVRIDNRQAVLDVHDSMDPFAVLGTTPIKVDVYTIGQTARAYLNRAYDQRNPLYQAALNLLLVYEKDPYETKKMILEDLMVKAVEQVILQMHEAVDISIKSLSKSPLRRPTSQDVYQGKSRKIVLSRLNKPNDVAAEWLAAALDCPFISTSSFHMILRSWLVSMTPEQTHSSQVLAPTAVKPNELFPNDHFVAALPPLRERSSPAISVVANRDSSPAVYYDPLPIPEPPEVDHLSDVVLSGDLLTEITDDEEDFTLPTTPTAVDFNANEATSVKKYNFDPKGITGPIDPDEPRPKAWEIGWFFMGASKGKIEKDP